MRERVQEAIRLTQEMVRINSENPGEYEGKLGNYVYDYLAASGAEVFREEVFSGRDNIIARLEGEDDVHRLILINHMDTVPIGLGWDDNIDPLGAEIRDGKIWGRGSCDMKSGLACGMAAFCAVAEEFLQTGRKPKHTFLFIASTDEEAEMVGADVVVKNGWATNDSWVLDNEPTGNTIQVGHKGKTWFEITAHGLAAHASTPEKGHDAVSAMAEFIHSLNEKLEQCPPNEVLGVCAATYGTINGGLNINIVPDTCAVEIDMRLVPPTTNEQSVRMVEESVKEAEAKVPGVTFNVLVTSKRPAIPMDPEAFLLKQLKMAVKKCTGEEAEVTFFPGYTDTAVIAALTGNNNCVSYGPGSLSAAHKPNEYVPLTDIERVEPVLEELARSILF